MHNPASISNCTSLSMIRYIGEQAFSLSASAVVFYLFTIAKKMMYYYFSFSRKLLLSRKRDTVYTRSTGGFSLRKSKVLSVSGTSLKWSKSIERRSKKANEVGSIYCI